MQKSNGISVLEFGIEVLSISSATSSSVIVTWPAAYSGHAGQKICLLPDTYPLLEYGGAQTKDILNRQTLPSTRELGALSQLPAIDIRLSNVQGR
jgi:hypothetical protein